MKEINVRMPVDMALRVSASAKDAAAIWGEIYYNTSMVDGIPPLFRFIENLVEAGAYRQAFDVLYVLYAMDQYALELPIRWLEQKPKIIEHFMKEFVRESYIELEKIDEIDDEIIQEQPDCPDFTEDEGGED